MEEPEKKRIKLSLEVDIYKKNYEKGYEQSYMNLFDSNILPYDILRIIFQYLNGRDLSNVTMVCRFWSEAADHEKYLRGPYLRVFECPRVYIRDNKGKHKLEKEYFDYIHDNITQSTIKPAIGLFFQSSYIFNGIKDDRFLGLLPKNCKIITLLANTLILSKYGNYKCTLREEEVICALLPQSPNVEIGVFKIINNYPFASEYENFVDMIDRVAEQNQTSTCVMIFCGTSSHGNGFIWYSYAKKRLGYDDKNTILLCDGSQNGIYYCEVLNLDQYDTSYCVAILITGSIRTWSIDIKCEHKTRKQYKDKLKSFKEKVNLQKHSVGFIFGCQREDNHVSDLVKVELFNRVFPKVPLIGCLSCCPSYKFVRDFGYELLTHECTLTYMILTYEL